MLLMKIVPHNSLFLKIGPGDFLFDHLSLHKTTLILVKGVLDACSSKLMSYKNDFSYSFSSFRDEVVVVIFRLGTYFIRQFCGRF